MRICCKESCLLEQQFILEAMLGSFAVAFLGNDHTRFDWQYLLNETRSAPIMDKLYRLHHYCWNALCDQFGVCSFTVFVVCVVDALQKMFNVTNVDYFWCCAFFAFWEHSWDWQKLQRANEQFHLAKQERMSKSRMFSCVLHCKTRRVQRCKL